MAIQSKNPANGETIKTYQELSESEIVSKIDTAQKAFSLWKNASFDERAKLVRSLAQYIRTHALEMSELQSLEMGKTVSSGMVGMEKCAALCEYYADNSERFLANEKIEDAVDERYVAFEPLGIILAIEPWNLPFWQAYRCVIPAIMAGNVCVLKHASNVPGCAEFIEKSFVESGFSKGVFQNLCIGSSKVEGVIRDPRIMAVALTGSESAGSTVARISGESLKKCVLELGGSDPFIVFPGVDVKKVAQTAVTARLGGNAGQVCISAKRFIVHESIFDEFVSEAASYMSNLSIGDPMNEKTDVGPLATESGLNVVEQQVSKSVELGAKIICGGKRIEGQGNYYMPTILTNVSKGMPVIDEEVFGPVMPIISFNNEDEAVSIANDTPYGLGASLWTNDNELAHKIIPLMCAGNVFVNKIVSSDQRAPFGGIKRSGYGRELSSYGIKEFVNVKNVFISNNNSQN